MNMIALVSDQRMQNVIPAMQKGAKYEQLVLVMSKDRRTGKPLAHYQRSAEDLKAVLAPVVSAVTISDRFVDPFNIEHVRETVAGLVSDLAITGPTVVNISGGTKPMAIGALQAAQSLEVRGLYTDTENGEILWLSPDGSIDTDLIDVHHLGVSAYIRAYGETVASASKVTDLAQEQVTWATLIGDNHRVLFDNVINRVNRQVREARQDGAHFPIRCTVASSKRSREIIQELENEGLWRWHAASEEVEVVDRRSAVFLNGIWVEVYVAVKMEANDAFDDVFLNVTLSGVDGEIDVAAVSNGKLVLIECKSNLTTSEHLGKLDSFRRRLGGPFAKAYYARASSAYFRRIKAQCAKVRLNGVFFGPELSDIGRHIGDAMGRVE